MFDKLGQFAGLMKNLPRLQEAMQQFQQQVGKITAEGDAGAGMVKVRVNGHMEVLSCKLSDDALRGGDREMLEDLIAAAANKALAKVRQQVQEETAKMTASFGLPPGMGLSGLG